MVSKELRKLSRRELVDIIYQLKKNEQRMQEEIAALEEGLQEKQIRISVAGSIAEAAADITNIFSTAQRTADLYLNEIARMKAEAEEECAKIIREARETAEKNISNSEQKLADLETRYQNTYTKWQQLQMEVHALEQIKKRASYEGIRNG